MLITRRHGEAAERAERDGTSECLRVAQRVFPKALQGEIAVAGGAARYFGPDSPMNEAGCLGIEAPVTDDDVERITAFFAERDVPARAMVSALSDFSLPQRLAAHGYAPIESQNVLLGDLRELEGAFDPRIRVAPDARAWGQAGAEAYSDGEPVDDDAGEVGATIASVPTVTALEAVIDGRVAAVGALGVNAEMAGLFFASTMPWARGKGLQLALLRHRIKLLQDVGAAYVRSAAAVASSSERNFRRAGLTVAFTRWLWERK
ncbi:MAG: hypothetical protein M3R30_05820 [Candidatus Eremiobacteraeota bacterium]|nr:hypothetical protein [Candidatus Eremiobacteraeota bacterium]